MLRNVNLFKSVPAPCGLYGVPVHLEEAGLSMCFEACLIQQSGDQIGNNPL